MDAGERAVAATTGVTRSEEQTIDSGGHARSTWRLEPAPPEANAARPGSQAGSACESAVASVATVEVVATDLSREEAKIAPDSLRLLDQRLVHLLGHADCSSTAEALREGGCGA